MAAKRELALWLSQLTGMFSIKFRISVERVKQRWRCWQRCCDYLVEMEARGGRSGKQQDRSVRSGAQPVQQLQSNAQNISGTVLNIERTLQELDTGKVIASCAQVIPRLW